VSAGDDSKGRSLSEDERILWRDVTRGIAPLRPRSAAAELSAGPETRRPAKPRRTVPQAEIPSLAPVQPAAPPPLAPLGRRTRQRVARGRDAIDGRLDLHGLTQAEAHGVLLRFLRSAQQREAKLVVVITGKGSRGEGGVLKRQVPLWLGLPEFRELVIGFEEAHRVHGGEGALYVRVRRSRAAE
jgi:DNA-nicking Smr family endonuclease